MLSRAIFNVIKDRFASVDLAQFKDLSVEDQVKTVGALRRGVLRKTTDAEIGAFVLLFRLQYGLVAPGSPEHFALRKELGIPDPAGWAKTPAPTTFPALFSTWLEEYQAATAATKYVDHASLWAKNKDPVKSIATRREALAAAIRHALGMGGLEDVLDPRAIAPGDATMDLLVSGAEANLQIQYPHWFDEKTGELLPTLPDDINGRSKVEQDILEQIDRAARKAAARQAAAEEQRAAQRAELAAKHASALAALNADSAFLTAVECAKTMSFEDLKAFLSAADVVPAPAGLTSADVTAALSLALSEAKPTWFRARPDGTPVMRRGEPRVVGSRKANSIAKNLTRLITKHGKSEVEAVLATL